MSRVNLLHCQIMGGFHTGDEGSAVILVSINISRNKVLIIRVGIVLLLAMSWGSSVLLT